MNRVTLPSLRRADVREAFRPALQAGLDLVSLVNPHVVSTVDSMRSSLAEPGAFKGRAGFDLFQRADRLIAGFLLNHVPLGLVTGDRPVLLASAARSVHFPRGPFSDLFRGPFSPSDLGFYYAALALKHAGLDRHCRLSPSREERRDIPGLVFDGLRFRSQQPEERQAASWLRLCLLRQPLTGEVFLQKYRRALEQSPPFHHSGLCDGGNHRGYNLGDTIHILMDDVFNGFREGFDILSARKWDVCLLLGLVGHLGHLQCNEHIPETHLEPYWQLAEDRFRRIILGGARHVYGGGYGRCSEPVMTFLLRKQELNKVPEKLLRRLTRQADVASLIPFNPRDLRFNRPIVEKRVRSGDMEVIGQLVAVCKRDPQSNYSNFLKDVLSGVDAALMREMAEGGDPEAAQILADLAALLPDSGARSARQEALRVRLGVFLDRPFKKVSETLGQYVLLGHRGLISAITEKVEADPNALQMVGLLRTSEHQWRGEVRSLVFRWKKIGSKPVTRAGDVFFLMRLRNACPDAIQVLERHVDYSKVDSLDLETVFSVKTARQHVERAALGGNQNRIALLVKGWNNPRNSPADTTWVAHVLRRVPWASLVTDPTSIFGFLTLMQGAESGLPRAMAAVRSLPANRDLSFVARAAVGSDGRQRTIFDFIDVIQALNRPLAARIRKLNDWLKG